MRRLFAVALVAAAAVLPASPAHASHYDRPCGGIVDAECSGRTCSLDCFPPRDCLVWLDPFHSPHSAVCLGPVVAA